MAGLLVGSCMSAANFEVDSIGYNVISFDKLTCEVAYSNKTGKVLEIPAKVTFNSKTLSVTGIGASAFNGKLYQSIILSDSIKTINDNAFYDCTQLVSIDLGNSVQSIGASAFYNCKQLQDITIPPSVTDIYDYAFQNCTNLKKVNITDLSAWCRINFTDRSDYSSSNYQSNPLCYAGNLYLNGELLTSLRIPNDITTIKLSAFENCDCITELIIPENITYIENCAFYSCNNLKKVIIEDSQTELDYYQHIYYGSPQNGQFSGAPIEDLYLGRNLAPMQIGQQGSCYFFQNRKNFKKVTIGEFVTAIPYKLFTEASDLDTITSHSITPPGLAQESFHNNAYIYAEVNVPAEALSTYQSTAPWKNFWGLRAISETKQYTAVANYSGDQGIVMVNGSQQRPVIINEGEKVIFEIVAYDGYEITEATVNGKDITNELVNNTYTVEAVNENITLEVTFSKVKDVYLTISHAENGKVKIDAEFGDEIELNVLPANGWGINTVSFNGEDVTYKVIDGNFTTPALTGASALSVVFVKDNDGVEATMALTDIKVYGNNRIITINGANQGEAISVYAVNGQLIYNGTNTSIPVAENGVYIVIVGGNTFKVAL